MGDNHLVLNQPDTQAGRMVPAIVDLSQRKPLRNESEIPQSLRSLLPRRDYVPPPNVASLEVQNIEAGSKGMSIVVGLHQKQNQPTFLAGVFANQKDPVFYPKHRWNIVAGACSLSAGLCATADSFGEIHIWKASNGEPVSYTHLTLPTKA